MPELFWQKIEDSNWQRYFVENKEDAEIVIIRTKTKFNKNLFDEFPKLKVIIRAGSGIDNIDLNEAKNRNIIIYNTPNANTQAAFEHTLSFILALIKRHEISKMAVINNTWKTELSHNLEISDLRVLVVGVGRVGTKVAKTLHYLGASVKGVDPYLSKAEWQEKNIEKITYPDGLKWCNLLTFHCPLSAETHDYFSFRTLNLLQNPIWIVNTARGAIVNENTILEGLKNEKLLGVALDVFEKEPWNSQDFAKLQNVILSPHSGSFTQKAKMRLSVETLKIWAKFVF